LVFFSNVKKKTKKKPKMAAEEARFWEARVVLIDWELQLRVKTALDADVAERSAARAADNARSPAAAVIAAAVAYWHDHCWSHDNEAPSPLERRTQNIPAHREWTHQMIWAEAALCAASIRATLCEAVQRKFGTLHERVVRSRKMAEKKKLFIIPDLACQLCKVRGLPEQCLHKIAKLPRWKEEDRRAAAYLSRAPRRDGPPRRTSGKSV
jgi:hypothetical protein